MVIDPLASPFPWTIAARIESAWHDFRESHLRSSAFICGFTPFASP